MRARPEDLTQPALFAIDAAPVKVRQHGLRAAHTFPLVSPGKNLDGSMACFRVPAKHAWKFPSLELRGGHVWPALILDLDQFSSYEGFCHLMWERASNGHCHAVWALATPVHRGSRARPKPLYALACVSEYFTQAAQADPRYNGVLTHNPMKRAHQRGTFATHWGTKRPYTLSQLLAYVPKHWRRPRLPASDIGRHDQLYRGGMKWAGSEFNLGRPVVPYLLDHIQSVYWAVGPHYPVVCRPAPKPLRSRPLHGPRVQVSLIKARKRRKIPFLWFLGQ